MFIDLSESDTQSKLPTKGRMYQKQLESKRRILWERNKNPHLTYACTNDKNRG